MTITRDDIEDALHKVIDTYSEWDDDIVKDELSVIKEQFIIRLDELYSEANEKHSEFDDET